MYRYHLQYPEGQLYLSGSHELKNHPNVYVSISSRSLWLNGPAAAVDGFRKRVEAFGGTIEDIVPSRVDLAADLVIPGGLTFDFLRSHLVTSSRTLRPVIKDGRLETLYVGDKDSPIQLRIYDKWAEIRHSGKVHCLDVWRDKLQGKADGVQGDEVDFKNVWRVEGQFRRAVLKQFAIHSLDDLYAKLGGLWAYLTSWASLRVPDDANSARRTIHPLWAMVQSAGDLLGDPADVTRHIKSDATAPVDWYVHHMAGCLVGFAARQNIKGMADALRALEGLAGTHMPPAAFAARVQSQVIRLGCHVEGAGSVGAPMGFTGAAGVSPTDTCQFRPST